MPVPDNLAGPIQPGEEIFMTIGGIRMKVTPVLRFFFVPIMSYDINLRLTCKLSASVMLLTLISMSFMSSNRSRSSLDEVSLQPIDSFS